MVLTCPFKPFPSGDHWARAIPEYEMLKSRTSSSKFNLFDKIINKEIPLAVASGISIDNLDYLFNYVNYFLVSSSISKSDSLFDENKFKEFNNRFLALKNDKCNKVSILFN